MNDNIPAGTASPKPLRDFLRFAELAIYNIVALMLAITAVASLASAAQLLRVSSSGRLQAKLCAFWINY